MKTYAQYRRLEGIAATRVRLGFSQQAFADQLGISRSMVSKAETRRSTLPTYVLVKLANLEITMAAAMTAKTNAAQQALPVEVENSCTNDHAPMVLEYKEMKCRAEAESLQCQLKLMENKYKQLRDSLTQVEAMIEGGNSVPGNLGTVYLQGHRLDLLKKINKVSQPAQADLRHRVALLHAAAELHLTVRKEFS